MLTLLILTLEVFAISIHYLIGIWNQILAIFEQNQMVQYRQNFELFGKEWLTILEKVLA